MKALPQTKNEQLNSGGVTLLKLCGCRLRPNSTHGSYLRYDCNGNILQLHFERFFGVKCLYVKVKEHMLTVAFHSEI